MNNIALSWLWIGLSLGLGSCGLIVAETTTPPSSTTAAIARSSQEPTPPPLTVPTVTVTRYKIDTQCQNLTPTDLEVEQTKSLDKTVETIIGDRSNGDFRITGYRLKIDPSSKTATLDLRLPPDSPRTIHSLSHCEQFALFGELRETLTKNPAWQIHAVEFQLQGESILF